MSDMNSNTNMNSNMNSNNYDDEFDSTPADIDMLNSNSGDIVDNEISDDSSNNNEAAFRDEEAPGNNGSNANSDDDERSVRTGNRLFTGSVVRETQSNEEKAVFDFQSPMEEVNFDLNIDTDINTPHKEEEAKDVVVFHKAPGAGDVRNGQTVDPDDAPVSAPTPMPIDPPDVQGPHDSSKDKPAVDKSRELVPPMEHSPEAKKQGLTLLLVSLVFLGIVLGLLFGFVFVDKDDDNNSSSPNDNKTPPTVPTEPTNPVYDPSKPVTRPDDFYDNIQLTQRQRFIQLLVDAGISDARDFLSLDTPQARAASFITYLDDQSGLPTDMPVVIDDSNKDSVQFRDRYILMVLYHSTGGSSNHWVNDDGFGKTDLHVCDWFGVECTASGKEVVGLDFNNNNLVGMIPQQELSYLSLNALDVSNNPMMRGSLNQMCASRTRLGGVDFTYMADSCSVLRAGNLVDCDCCAC
eukprot:CAMPEP_0119546506 /NCGR_PEP_ID=MMETSP1352-20130426/898_1 /TAXON_ID=265584 /ORGANISM="Stauroneis constricta, Strain CCMP1120" /LENGTH=463 /DNA_ID=CAMNT_0007591217 /DNA_START=218 /DNA_END=1609 /DNA_ORIENTATION=-